MKVSPTQTVGQIAVEFKEAIPIFEKYEINYYTGGTRCLKDACYLANVPLEEVTATLEKIESAPKEWYTQERDWRQEPMAELIDYVVNVHHAYTRAQLDQIEKMLARLLVEKGSQNPKLLAVNHLFLKMAEELKDHLREEEEVVFPYLIQAERAMERKEPVPKPFAGYSIVNHPIRVLLFEHGMMDREWREIGEQTGHFLAPLEDRQLLQPLYEAMKELEKDNRKHVHLENNILLKRAVEMGLLE
jgi:regulator of cell morphogenesis and NO signaling